ncbi:MAG: SHOCT domain-containing protein [Clostridia bacterium]|nr:SHOCT domain-containing protein [Clostridia bacterium]
MICMSEKNKKVLHIIGLILSVVALAFSVWHMLKLFLWLSTISWRNCVEILVSGFLIFLFLKKNLAHKGIFLLCTFVISQTLVLYSILSSSILSIGLNSFYHLSAIISNCLMSALYYRENCVWGFLVCATIATLCLTVDRINKKSFKRIGLILTCIALCWNLLSEVAFVFFYHDYGFDWANTMGLMLAILSAALLLFLYTKKQPSHSGIFLLATLVAQVLILFLRIIAAYSLSWQLGMALLGGIPNVFDILVFTPILIFFLTADREQLRLIPLTPEKELKILMDKHKNGKITDEEYETKRKEIISKL